MEGKILFGKYETGKLLGEGNFGKVYLARSLETGETVAIKMMNKDQVKKQGMAEQVKKEISVMHLVKHPNIVDLKEVMATKTSIYLVMEYVKGGDLYTKILNKGKLDENLAKKYFQQLITAVDFCHSRGICHRDLKPENILLDPIGERLKLADFGLATLPGQEQSNPDGLLYTPCGAFAYMAPEIIRGEKYDGKKADIWSCGVILYTLLAGYPPFQDENRLRMLWKIRKVHYDFPTNFSQNVKDLIRMILVKKPSERITIDGVMRSPWFQPFDYDHVQFESTSGEGFPCFSPVSFNAFDFMLSTASGLDLSGLFEGKRKKLGSSFVTRSSRKEVVKAVEEMAKGFEYEVKRVEEVRMVLRGAKVGRRGRLVVGVEVFEVSPEIKVVDFSRWGGDSFEFLKMMEEEIRPAMKDVVWKWQGDWVCKRNNGGRR